MINLVASVKVRSNSQGNIGARASGGPTQAGVPYLVNERTPRSEVYVPSASGHVLTRAQAIAGLRESLGAGYGGGDVINVNMPVTGVIRAETPGDLARPLRQLAASGAISNPRKRQRVEVPTRG